MKPETQEKIKYGIGGLICGAVLTLIIGFAWGGWSTLGMSKERADDAVVAAQAAICVAQFMQEPDHESLLKELSETKSWNRDDFVKKGGWDKMPGQEKAYYGVADACASGLELLAEKSK